MDSNIKELRNKLNLTLKEFGLKIGRSFQAIQQYESGKRQIDDTTILLICKTFNVSEKWLREGIGAMFIEGGEKSNQEQVARTNSNFKSKQSSETSSTFTIPYHNLVAASAGYGVDIFDEHADDEFHISPKLLPVNPNHNVRCIKVSGTSMMPRINDGDFIFIDLSENVLRTEGIYVLRVDNTLLIKHIQWTPDGLRLISENKDYETVFISAEKFEYASVAIIGKVIGVFSNY